AGGLRLRAALRPCDTGLREHRASRSGGSETPVTLHQGGRAIMPGAIQSRDVLLSVEGLSKTFQTGAGAVHALKDVSFSIPRGSVVGLVGESGSGKTTLGRCLLRLVEPSAGTVLFDGTDLLALGSNEMKRMRKRMQIIFQ